MEPYPKQIKVYRGDYFYDSFRVRHRVWNPAYNDGLGGWGPGPYRDMSGWTGNFQIRATHDSEAVMGQGDVFIIDQGEILGGVQFSMEHTETESLIRGEAVYDVQLTDPDGRPHTFLAGVALIDPDVTRA